MTLLDWPKLETNWIDEEWSPRIDAWVKLNDGRELKAIYTMGTWETIDGQVIIGVKAWQPIGISSVRRE